MIARHRWEFILIQINQQSRFHARLVHSRTMVPEIAAGWRRCSRRRMLAGLSGPAVPHGPAPRDRRLTLGLSNGTEGWMTIDELLARESIRHLIATYNIAGDAMRPEDLAAVFADDAIYEFNGFSPVPGFHFEGRAAIREASAGWRKRETPAKPSKLSFVRHNITTCRIELTAPDTATARTYWMVMTDIGPDHSGTYNDVFRREGDGWRIAHRKIRVDWRSPDSLFPPLD
ncbi:MAG: nuclear transport factor 2 family protein [Sphingomonadales bacterium]|nr:MAG: nuclear transport factor 2 family protein [Sphingomonadales bacterium]